MWWPLNSRARAPVGLALSAPPPASSILCSGVPTSSVTGSSPAASGVYADECEHVFSDNLWSKYFDEASGKTYWENVVTQEVVGTMRGQPETHPDTPKSPYSKTPKVPGAPKVKKNESDLWAKKTIDGKTFFFNRKTGKLQWNRPIYLI